MAFREYLKFSVLRVVGEILFYLGFAVAGVGVAFFLARAPTIILMFFIGIGTVLSVSGYIVYKYGKFKENAEQIASGVTKGIQNVPNTSNQAPPPPTNPCPNCQHPLTFIEQYKAWYCFNCKEYK